MMSCYFTRFIFSWEFIAVNIYSIAYILDPGFFPFDYLTSVDLDYYENMISSYHENIIDEERDLTVYSDVFN